MVSEVISFEERRLLRAARKNLLPDPPPVRMTEELWLSLHDHLGRLCVELKREANAHERIVDTPRTGWTERDHLRLRDHVRLVGAVHCQKVRAVRQMARFLDAYGVGKEFSLPADWDRCAPEGEKSFALADLDRAISENPIQEIA